MNEDSYKLFIIGKLGNLPFSMKIIASMSGTKSSAIWKYFEIPTEENKKYAKCKLCGEMKSLGSLIPRYRTLGCLKNHIKRIHKMEWPNLNQDLQNSTLISKSKIALAQQEFAKKLQGGPKAENFDANEIIPNISFMSKNGDLIENNIFKVENPEPDSKSSHVHEKTKKNADLKCYLCDKEFENSTEFVEHNEKRHPGVQTMVCDWCNKLFRQPSRLKEHIEMVHEKKKSISQPNVHKGKTEMVGSNLADYSPGIIGINNSNFGIPISKLENCNTDNTTIRLAVNQPTDFQFIAFMKDENESPNGKLEYGFPSLDMDCKNIGNENLNEEKNNSIELVDLNGIKIEEFYDDITENDN